MKKVFADVVVNPSDVILVTRNFQTQKSAILVKTQGENQAVLEISEAAASALIKYFNEE